MMRANCGFSFPATQAGASLISVVCVLLVVVSTLSLALKLGPHYIDFRTIQSVVDQLPPNEVNTMPRAAVFEALEKRFPLNNLYDFKVRDIIQYERGPEATVVTVAYEKRENLFMNVDVVIKFDKRYEYR
jgi:hypothetical protein